MKHLALLTCLLSMASAATASPKVGNFERFRYIGDAGGKQVVYEVRNDLVQFNAKSKTFTMRQTVINPGQEPKFTDSTVTARSLVEDRQEAQRIVEHCASEHGVIENVRVPAGTFRACKVESKEPHSVETTWYFPGPFSGYVRSDIQSEILSVDRQLIGFSVD